ncbi:MAG: AAA family ATPase [Myxococcales bacterium]|nr:AAA family ATPase [Myxococcales bacterium]
MAAQLSAIWVKPVSVDADLLVDRDVERDRLVRWVTEAIELGEHDARFLITGDRGVGKSILCRWCLSEVEKRESEAVGVVVDGRGRSYRDFLTAIALAVVERLSDDVGETAPLRRYLDELALLASHRQVKKSQADALATKFGAQGGAETKGLFITLRALFSWEQTRTTSHGAEISTTVTDELLHRAISEVFIQIKAAGRFLVLLLDDLDQGTASSADGVNRMVGEILRLRPCLALVHLRNEAMFQDVRREITQTLEVPPLPDAVLVELLARRATQAMQRTGTLGRLDVKNAYDPFRALARAAGGNPYVFLRWAEQLLSAFDFPPPPDWVNDASLWTLVRASAPGADEDLVRPVARLVDRCALAPNRPWCRREDLDRGGLATDTAPLTPVPKTTLDQLVVLEYLIRRNRFDDPPVYRLDPVLDLLRPSVARLLRSS